MTNLKKETQKVEGSINVLKSELEVLNKNGIKEQINNDKKTINLLEDLLENSNIQKSYPKYNKLKKTILYSSKCISYSINNYLNYFINLNW